MEFLQDITTAYFSVMFKKSSSIIEENTKCF